MTSVVKRPRKLARIPAAEGKSIRRLSPHDADRSAYANREQSWLAFNRRVLDQACNPVNPLLERVKFLAIVSSNLDEFFEIRVAGLMQQVDAVAGELSLDGLLPREQLKRVQASAAALVHDQYRCWHEQLVPALAKEGILFHHATRLTPEEDAWVRQYFQAQVLPVLTPLAIDQAHPFPQIGNKTLNVLVSLDNPDTPDNENLMILLPVPRILPRIVQIEPQRGRPGRYIFLSEIIKLCAGALFPGYRVNSAHAFRITRNSDLYIDDEEAENLLKKIEEELRNLRRGATVRLEIEAGVDEGLFTMLCGYLGLSPEYAYRLEGPLNFLRLMSLYETTDRPDLKFPPFTPAELPALRSYASIFEAIRAREFLLHHPYDSFEPVVDFVEQAARDPDVFAIKQTFYRTSGDSPIVRAMMDAAINGKQVTALVELKARFDEANNIHWARQMEDAGVHVVYGLIGHKTHCKCSLVVRREGDALRRYVHLGSGNYNPKTARLYTDLSFFTTNEAITSEVAQLFNTLTGAGRTPEFRELLVAPFNLHARIQELIAAEAANAAAGKPARIMAKMNKLVDQVTIDNLYAASQAGVQIDLIVRATCCLRPGVKGLSENIRVRSIVGRFLEHARTFYFENGGQPLVYCGSADWMSRNFFRRVETLFPIYDPELRQRIIDDLLPIELRDNEDARELQPDGSYRPPTRPPGEPGFCAQRYFMAAAGLRAVAPVVAAPAPVVP
ncbi:polyphosphate kinase 1 [Opitutus terrae]|uniref:Polyphosphate kinase n=1 Tax=Opitutus terrae (strain DSM 11246 / JCM 15787 / PB90-1) TaxID=452637 RepID=B1ZZG9_OPITP|nr:polyphosphate kinase 1 [Opitutus terrae]ACB76372.1 Polyphosphate kinase [Opitutus terrae PB90-1]